MDVLDIVLWSANHSIGEITPVGKSRVLIRYVKLSNQFLAPLPGIQCNKKGHLKKDCPTLRRNGQDGNNRGAAYKLGVVDAQQDPKVVTGDRNNSRLKIVSCIKAQKYIEKGCELFLAQVTKQESKEKRLEDVPVIRDFPGSRIFRKDLPGLPPPRQAEFRIDLIPGAAPVARAPYHLAPTEMKEFFPRSSKSFVKGFYSTELVTMGSSGVVSLEKEDESSECALITERPTQVNDQESIPLPRIR
ncbi:hypothetical protein Tco_0146206 [Tanacetum coccineum]